MGTSFLGQGWSFPPQFDPNTKALMMVWDEDDIQESLRILLSTEPGERIMQPSYGCRIRRYMFETPSEHMLTELKQQIRMAISYFETRIELLDIQAQVMDHLGGVLQLALNYRIRTTNVQQNLVFPFYLQSSTASVL